MEKEIFKDIPGYEGIYQVSNLGRVKSLTRKVNSPIIKKHGYRTVKSQIMKPWTNGLTEHQIVSLSKNNKKTNCPVHQLVLLTFVSPPPLNMEVRHLDDNPKNNHISNLAYGTHKQNFQDAIRNNKTPKGERNGHSKLKEHEVKNIRKLKNIMSTSEIANKYNVSNGCINDILKNKRWSWLK